MPQYDDAPDPLVTCHGLDPEMLDAILVAQPHLQIHRQRWIVDPAAARQRRETTLAHFVGQLEHRSIVPLATLRAQ